MKGTIYRGNGENLDFIDISESDFSVRSNTDGEERRKKRKHDNQWGGSGTLSGPLDDIDPPSSGQEKKHDPPVITGFYHS